MSTRPTLAEVRAAIGVPATALPDEDLTRIYEAEDASQATRCHGVLDESVEPPVPASDVPAPLNQAFIRRIQREVAVRNLPLGMVGIDSEYGAQKLPGTDAVADDLERPYRKQVLA